MGFKDVEHNPPGQSCAYCIGDMAPAECGYELNSEGE